MVHASHHAPSLAGPPESGGVAGDDSCPYRVEFKGNDPRHRFDLVMSEGGDESTPCARFEDLAYATSGHRQVIVWYAGADGSPCSCEATISIDSHGDVIAVADAHTSTNADSVPNLPLSAGVVVVDGKWPMGVGWVCDASTILVVPLRRYCAEHGRSDKDPLARAMRVGLTRELSRYVNSNQGIADQFEAVFGLASMSNDPTEPHTVTFEQLRDNVLAATDHPSRKAHGAGELLRLLELIAPLVVGGPPTTLEPHRTPASVPGPTPLGIVRATCASALMLELHMSTVSGRRPRLCVMSARQSQETARAVRDTVIGAGWRPGDIVGEGAVPLAAATSMPVFDRSGHRREFETVTAVAQVLGSWQSKQRSRQYLVQARSALHNVLRRQPPFPVYVVVRDGVESSDDMSWLDDLCSELPELDVVSLSNLGERAEHDLENELVMAIHGWLGEYRTGPE